MSDSGCPLGIFVGEAKSRLALLLPLLIQMLTARAGEKSNFKSISEIQDDFTIHKYQGDHDRCHSSCWQRLLILRVGYSVPRFFQMIAVNLVFHQRRQSVSTHRWTWCL